jgi:hypothetical protein
MDGNQLTYSRMRRALTIYIYRDHVNRSAKFTTNSIEPASDMR